ncbi:MAG TPA: 2-C-methyl-D-erythritol 4-phosphate cytidylyltransferase, partial [Pseudomonadales bacterium]|nr:2-C-methyl-D-erythritol 4-phosphate cytidylyltransferase [Pseudomonadales bacterium]
MSNTSKYWVLIPAAGFGARMGSAIPKQYLSLLGKTVLEHTLERWLALACIEAVVVVVAENDPYWPTMSLKQHPKIHTVFGGLERMHSVLNGLQYLQKKADASDWVLVHDAARPCVRHSDVSALMAAVKTHPVGGLLACPVRDTMKRSQAGADSTIEVLETVQREQLWHALT